VLDGVKLLSRTAKSGVLSLITVLQQVQEPFTSSLSLEKRPGSRLKVTELVNILKVPDGAIYYHTHQFLQEHNYLIPEPPNDFAVWVAASLGDDVLGERLANVNPFSFQDLAGVRGKLVNIIEEHLGQYSNHREAMEGNEFYFEVSDLFFIHLML
jgi:hypothetical protein